MAPRALYQFVRELYRHTAKVRSKQVSIASGQGTPGDRATPSKQTEIDKKMGCRVTVGHIVNKDGKDFRTYYLQANQDAYNSTIKELADKYPNKRWSHADVPMNTKEEDVEAVVKQMFNDFEANMVD